MKRYLVPICLAFGLAVSFGYFSAAAIQVTAEECQALAHDLALTEQRSGGRSDLGATERQAYRACVADPVGFRQLVRTAL